MDMGFAVIPDLISLALVLYVWLRLFETRSLNRKTEKLFRFMGIFLIFALVMDQVWEYFYQTLPAGEDSAMTLNRIASAEFMCVPCMYIALILFHWDKKDIGDLAALILSASGILLFIVNMFMPVLFVHDEDFYMHNTPYTRWIYLCAFVLLAYILIHDFLKSFDSDRENRTIILFVIIIAGLGMLDCYLYFDVIAVWECCAIAYLLLYLAIVRLYDKRDPVTGLPNRNAFNTVFFYRRRKFRTIAAFDLNHLKQYNDRYGHSTGDEYLRAFALTMKEKLSPYGKLYRTGGDEFCFLTSLDPDKTADIITEIRREGKCDPAYGDYPLDFSFGVTERKPEDSNENLYMRADSLMYIDKRRVEDDARIDPEKEDH